ncbi:MAG: hypothetical protein RLZZ118_1312 [Bacteroidota bacterium]|jgi:hypothetical protein
MKHKILACLLGLIIVSVAKAQRHSISINSGYVWKSLGTSLPDNLYFRNVTIDSNILTFKPSRFSLGEGKQFGLNYTYSFQNHIGVSVDVEYQKGKSLISHLWSDDGFTDLKINSKKSQISVGLLLNVQYKKIGISGIFGPSFNSCKFDYSVFDITGEDTTKLNYLYTGNITIGLKNSLQFNYSLNKKMSIRIGGNFNAFNFSPAKRVLTKYEWENKDYLSSVKPNYKQTNYINYFKEENLNSNPTPQDENKPREELKQVIPFSSIGCHLGFVYKF